jgi:hypothetical protein
MGWEGVCVSVCGGGGGPESRRSDPEMLNHRMIRMFFLITKIIMSLFFLGISSPSGQAVD